MKTLRILRVLALAVLTLMVSLLMGSPVMAEGSWVTVTNGQIISAIRASGNSPTNIQKGNETDGTPLYIARVAHEGGVHIGKVRANALEAFIPFGGQELPKGNYQVYVGTGTWVRINAGQNIPTNAIQGGSEADGTPLYIARATIDGGIHPGKARGTEAFIPYGGREQVVTSFDVLVLPGVVPTVIRVRLTQIFADACGGEDCNDAYNGRIRLSLNTVRPGSSGTYEAPVLRANPAETGNNTIWELIRGGVTCPNPEARERDGLPVSARTVILRNQGWWYYGIDAQRLNNDEYQLKIEPELGAMHGAPPNPAYHALPRGTYKALKIRSELLRNGPGVVNIGPFKTATDRCHEYWIQLEVEYNN